MRDERASQVYKHLDFGGRDCHYCGDPASERDHVFPISEASNNIWTPTLIRTYRELLITVPSCNECNSIAGDAVFDSFQKKREFILDKLEKKYQNLLRFPEWDDDELNELGPTLRSDVCGRLVGSNWIRDRLDHRHKVMPGHDNTP